MASPALCGSVVTSKRSFLALAWTLTSVLSSFCFGVSLVFAVKINRQYGSMVASSSNEYADWSQGYWNNNGDWNYNDDDCDQEDGEDGEENSGSNDNGEGCQENNNSNDNASYESPSERLASLAAVSSRGMAFAGAYSAALGLALGLYGTTVVVGFTTLKGEYVPPCFTSHALSPSYNNEGDPGAYASWDAVTGPKKSWAVKMHRGIFLGCLVAFANLLIVCAVIFGEFQVFGNNNDGGNNQQQNGEGNNSYPPYRIEKLSAVFSATCIALAVIYLLFAVVYLSCGGTSTDLDDPNSYGSDGIMELSSVGGGIGVGVDINGGRHRGFMRADDHRYDGDGGRERRSMGGAASGGRNNAAAVLMGGGVGERGSRFGFPSSHPSDEDRAAKRCITDEGGFITDVHASSSSTNSDARWRS